MSIFCNLKERLIEPFGSIKRSDWFGMKNKTFINHLHPLAILVVWTFRDFERVKVKKNEKKIFDSISLSIVIFHRRVLAT